MSYVILINLITSDGSVTYRVFQKRIRARISKSSWNFNNSTTTGPFETKTQRQSLEDKFVRYHVDNSYLHKQWNCDWNKNIAGKSVATNDPIIWFFPILIGAHSQTEVQREWFSFNYYLYTMEQSAWGSWMPCSYAHSEQSVLLIDHVI